MEKKHVIFSHLYNDFSGSPNVLSQVAQYFIQEGYDAHIITSDTHGFLSDIKGASYTTYNYRPSGNKLAMLCKLLFTQLRVFIYTLRMCRRDTVVYVNTLYPFGAALAGKLMGCRVI